MDSRPRLGKKKPARTSGEDRVDPATRPRLILAVHRVLASDDVSLRPQPVSASGAAATRTGSEASAAATRAFGDTLARLVESKMLTETEAKRFTFDPRYAAFKVFKNRSGNDEVVSGSGQFFSTREERNAFLREYRGRNKDRRYNYAVAHGYTDSRWPLFGSPSSVIYRSAAEQGPVEGLIQELAPRLMMSFTIMHESAHQIGIRSEDAATAYAARRLGIRNSPPGGR